MFNRFTYSVAQLPEAAKSRLGLSQLSQQQWRYTVNSDPIQAAQQFFSAVYNKKITVKGEIFQSQINELSRSNAQQQLLQFLMDNLRISSDTDEQLHNYCSAIRMKWNTDIEQAWQFHVPGYDNTSFSETIDIRRDPTDGAVYIEVTYSDIKLGKRGQTFQYTLPGALRLRLKLAPADVLNFQLGLQVEQIEASNFLLHRLFFSEQPVDETQLLTLIEQAKWVEAYRAAVDELRKTLVRDTVSSTLRTYANDVLQKVRYMAAQKGADLEQLADVVQATNKLVRNPGNSQVQARYLDLAGQVRSKRSWGKIIGGAMLVLLGVVLIATAVALAVTTAGIGTPLSAVVAVIGVKVAIAGAVTAGVLGVAAVAGGSYSFYKGKKLQPAQAMQHLVEESRSETRPLLR
ncbi:MAG: hypothetical protein A3E83_07330 [Gammaproteobacteria bacterium RIFCSPHIGHO2_12_FULL_41_20]|nr:MAG: hypothetical protein A3E83_07330 [Gammaproteobacteria bacterium RIFCSPHIGHO2_12_FULL_41_20]